MPSHSARGKGHRAAPPCRQRLPSQSRSIDVLPRSAEALGAHAPPAGFLFFTYLGERYFGEWTAGQLEYGDVPEEQKTAASERFRRDGHAFCGIRTSYPQTDDYGIAFIEDRVVVAEMARRPALRPLELRPDVQPRRSWLSQDLAIVPKARWTERLSPWRRPH